MAIKKIIEDNILIINLYTIDNDEIMLSEMFDAQDGIFKTKEEEELEDKKYIDKLLKDNNLNIDKLENSFAYMYYNEDSKLFTIQLNDNKYYDKYIYPISFMEFLDRDIYFKIRKYFINPKKVIMKNISHQIGGVIDKNYGVKFNIEVIEKDIQIEDIKKDKPFKKRQSGSHIHLDSNKIKIDEEYSIDTIIAENQEISRKRK